MSIYADDVLTFTSVLKMAYNFLTGKDYLKRKKTREKKKLISVALGFPDLVFAAESIPVFPIRLESFQLNTLLLALDSATSVIGWDLTSKFLGIARQFDILNIVDRILDDVISSINNKYNQMYDLSIQHNMPSDLCYGINTLYGMHISKGQQLDTHLDFAMRCGEWSRISEPLKTLIPNQILVDFPAKESDKPDDNLAQMMENVKKAINELEILTGNYISDNSLQKVFRIGNQVKRFYKTILYDISLSDFYPCNPATFAEILALLTISFQDYNSNAQRYLDNMSYLIKEMREHIKKGIGMDVSEMPRLLFSPMYGGWDPEIHEIIYKLGGRIIYADWEILGLLEEIPVSNSTDPIEEYSKYLLAASSKGLGCDSENLNNSYIKAAKDLQVSGLIFNQVYGCPSISNTYDLLKKNIQQELELPVHLVNFKKIGGDIEDVKSSLNSFMNTIKT